MFTRAVAVSLCYDANVDSFPLEWTAFAAALSEIMTELSLSLKRTSWLRPIPGVFYSLPPPPYLTNRSIGFLRQITKNCTFSSRTKKKNVYNDNNDNNNRIDTMRHEELHMHTQRRI